MYTKEMNYTRLSEKKITVSTEGDDLNWPI